jgi:glycosyltransferase involved in cell wall biosynthesis
MNQQKESRRLSIVVPLYNEVLNIPPLIKKIEDALASYGDEWELILINDGSTDNTRKTLDNSVSTHGPHIRPIHFQRNFGQTAAMQAGIDAARGDVVVTMDGDLQNDPIDIPRLVNKMFDEDLDMVAGWRKDRKDKLLLRKIPSGIANMLIGKITGITLHDYGCSLKVYRAHIIKEVKLYGEMHRFIPAWVAMQTSPDRIKEAVVTHHARQFGVSKYGISRTFRVILDLMSVYFFMRYNARPGHFFGKIGLYVGSAGLLILAYLASLKIFLGEDIGSRPLLMLGVLLTVMSVQFLSTGILSELIIRTYYESGDKRSYKILNREEVEKAGAQNWVEHD